MFFDLRDNPLSTHGTMGGGMVVTAEDSIDNARYGETVH